MTRALKHRILFLKDVHFAVDVLGAIDDRAKAVDHGLVASRACRNRKRVVARGRKAVARAARYGTRVGPLRRRVAAGDHVRSIGQSIARLRLAQAPIAMAIRVSARVIVEII